MTIYGAPPRDGEDDDQSDWRNDAAQLADALAWEAQERELYLLGRLDPGMHDGLAICNIGMGAASAMDLLGIEGIVAVASTGTPEQFFAHAARVTGLDLQDWEPIRVTLYRTWEMLPEDLCRNDDDPAAFVSWSARQSSALYSNSSGPIEVNALRHRSWTSPKPAAGQTAARKFHSDRGKSIAIALWRRSGGSGESDPRIMEGHPTLGYSLSARPSPTAQSVQLTWPSPYLFQQLRVARRLKRKGVKHLSLCHSEIGFDANALSSLEWQRASVIDLRMNAALGDFSYHDFHRLLSTAARRWL